MNPYESPEPGAAQTEETSEVPITVKLITYGVMTVIALLILLVFVMLTVDVQSIRQLP
ncbi:MAG: hypothetical protein AAGG48_27890 [Planctomycetota bacterium]